MKGPEWLADILTEPSKEAEVEAKLTSKEVLSTVVETKDDLDETLNKHSFWKTMRVTAWIMHFIHVQEQQCFGRGGCESIFHQCKLQRKGAELYLI